MSLSIAPNAVRQAYSNKCVVICYTKRCVLAFRTTDLSIQPHNPYMSVTVGEIGLFYEPFIIVTSQYGIIFVEVTVQGFRLFLL